MEVLCISDISWEIPNTDILDTLKTEIDETSPELVLFGGDVINDGMNSVEHVTEFIELLNHLEENETTSFTISGNHDEYSNYDAVEEHITDLEYATEISQQVAEFNGLKVLGIPHSYTHSLRKARQISDEFSEQYDIVLAHAETSRRIWLFELDAQFVITGHFAEELCQIRDQVFVSMGAYPSDTVIVNPESGELLYKRRSDSHFASQDKYEAKARLENGELLWMRDESDPDVAPSSGLKNSDYSERIERLHSAKTEVKTASEDEEREIIEALLETGIPKTHIREYIGRYGFL